jgi:hypothetical protein
MKKLRIFFLTLLLLGFFCLPITVTAQSYSYEVPFTEVRVYIETDGTLSLEYIIEFENHSNAPAIEYVDIGMPTPSYSRSNIVADIDGVPLTNFESTEYAVNGFAIVMGENAIQPGQSGTINIWITGVGNVLYPYEDSDRENYVSFQFSPNWFDPEGDKSIATDYAVTLILPPGVGNDEGVYYFPENWPGSSEPTEIGRTEAEERVYYYWFTENANAHTQYIFGAAFPKQYVPEVELETKPPVTVPSEPGGSTGFFDSISAILCGNLPCCGFAIFSLAVVGWSIYQGTIGAKKRKMKYLPPKMKIEGNGIKRGLTAVEAAILMEQPMDKILTMILFGTLKKEAAVVTQEDPLEIQVTEPLPDKLHPYEVAFLESFKLPKAQRRQTLQNIMVDLVKSVSSKMKGFSLKETVAYYESIMQRAWKMVEEAETPEVKSEHYNNTMEWTMLDDEYQDRTRRTFMGGPVYVPMWWPRYSPVYRRNIGGTVSNPLPSSANIPSGGGSGKVSLPHIPGSDFAASVINGTTGMAAGVVGGLTSFTDGVTTRTNPIPVSTPRSGRGGFSGGGGSSCACACACAGCACACAGGGR